MKKNLQILILFIAMSLMFVKSFSQTNSQVLKRGPKVLNEFNLTFSYGGESKLALFLPKFEYLRIHPSPALNFYYGGSLGIHAAFVSGYGSISAIAGMEYNRLDFQTSLSHFRSLEAKIDDSDTRGPFSQDLLNLKLGIRFNKFRIRLGTSLLLKETVPNDQERIPLLDMGKIGTNLYLVEFQIIINRS